MAIGKSIRIYDLAKEVKQDTKRVMEDLRREGVDVSVASNSVPYEVAEKVRGKYFPKTEAAPKRAIKVIKKAAKTDDAVAEADTSVAPDAPEVEVAPVAEPIAKPVVVETSAPVAAEEEKSGTASTVKTLTKKPTAKPVAAEVAEETPSEPKRVAKPKADVTEEVAPVQTVEAEVETPAAVEVEETAPTPSVSKTGTTVKTLTLTKDAIEKGIKAGDKLVKDAPTQTGRLVAEPSRGRPGDGPRGLRGTPGENAAPQMTYTPPADNRRRPGRGGGRKGNDKTGRFAERDLDAPQKRTLE
ncbi:MAG: translation initiation factor IF-2 N-terminal domain-containing protein, partial [Pyrinomonadaceae bacterium]